MQRKIQKTEERVQINERDSAGKLITILGALFIILGVISLVNLVFRKTSLYEFILMLVLIFGGGALALRILFMPNVDDDKSKKRNKLDEINDKLN